MPDIYVNGIRQRLSSSNMIGEGGEAEIYLGSGLNSGKAIKLWKQPTHSDFDLPGEAGKLIRAEVKQRLLEYERKLGLFPQGLPPSVIGPQGMVTDSTGRVLGYTMQLVAGAEMLRRFTRQDFRDKIGIGHQDVVEILKGLWTTVNAVHQSGVVIGDFNDGNVLVKDRTSYVIDADSMQFGGFTTRIFTERFVDPLLCDQAQRTLIMSKPHSTLSDWYAFAVMFFENMLLVHPYFGGVHEPKGKLAAVPNALRPLRRISVFDRNVVWPLRALSPDRLPDDLLHYFHEVFERDRREAFPLKFLEGLHWTTCPVCGVAHARASCPICKHKAAPSIVTMIVRGKVRAERKYFTPGVIIDAAMHDGKLRLLLHENGQFKREDGSVVVESRLNPMLGFKLNGARTVLTMEDQAVLTGAGSSEALRMTVDRYRSGPACVATNSRNIFWISNGRLMRDDSLAPKFIGPVLANQTQIWVGEKFGLGISNANGLRAFLFEAHRIGINDSVAFPHVRGQLLEAKCVFNDTHAWLLLTVEDLGKTINRCFLIRSDGTIVASLESALGDPGWLGSVGEVAALDLLLVDGTSRQAILAATDAGLVRIEEVAGRLFEAATFPDTTSLVSSHDKLFVAKEGVYAVSSHEARLLSIAP